MHFPAFEATDISETRVRVKNSGLASDTNKCQIKVAYALALIN